MKPQHTGMTRIFKASIYSWQGLRSSWQSEAAIRQELWLLVVLLPVAFWLNVSGVERAMLVLSLLLILLVELLNTALEAVVDRIGPEHHPLSGKAKDVGSAAVLVALFAAALVWLCILL